VSDCSLAYVRGVEDPWNAIMAGGVTGGILAARAGPRAVARNAVFGMAIMALIEGFGIAVSKFFLQKQMEAMGQGRGYRDTLEPPVPPNFGSGSIGTGSRTAREYMMR
jgi:hypothetical protein